MTSLDDVFTSNTLKASDLGDSEVTLTIKGYEVKKFDDGAKPIIHFEETDKALVCNLTNGKRIANNLKTKDFDGWVGKEITLYSEKVEFKGDMVDAIRVKIEQPTRTAVKGKLPGARTMDERNPPPPLDDEIPF